VLAVDDPCDPRGATADGRTPASREEVNAMAILGHDLFGTAGAPPAPEGHGGHGPSLAPMGDALGLALVGTVSGDPRVARAILQDTGTKTAAVYKVGDKVAGATIEAISRDEIVLQYQGRRGILRRAEAVAQPSSQASAASGPAGAAGSHGSATGAPADTDGPARESVQQLMDRGKVTALVKDGQVEGIQIHDLDHIPGARQLGLVEGDVIQTVNGQRLTHMQKAFQVLKKARSQERIEIELLRNGQAKTLSLDLR
ncbi:MAG: PDZ domain-containing protein, partial [Phycisphaerae bacterium]|nr:PDZ domain-containing protein [Phycisphaerae bacterium]